MSTSDMNLMDLLFPREDSFLKGDIKDEPFIDQSYNDDAITKPGESRTDTFWLQSRARSLKRPKWDMRSSQQGSMKEILPNSLGRNRSNDLSHSYSP